MFLAIAKWLVARRPGMTIEHATRVTKIGMALAAIVLLVLGVILFFHFHDKGVIEEHELKREVAAGEEREVAADQRVKDAVENREQEEDYREAIQSAPGGELSPAARALACERLRKLGRIPPACRPAGGDRGEADPE